jgi:hypothetical protein
MATSVYLDFGVVQGGDLDLGAYQHAGLNAYVLTTSTGSYIVSGVVVTYVFYTPHMSMVTDSGIYGFNMVAANIRDWTSVSMNRPSHLRPRVFAPGLAR